ncbi:hypothetical protein GLAREA_08357 [Glarea lozoyensis ATCC 20868]|uniref:Hydrophobin n=1 Tax=Glarea lozoyensis (strain ATCC 20868 / MF5171) TaxID=1116229 RepID=S3CET1_GLAL2|nr:uncharacterized protein GLAREA_08357 [Glarea lozoyensis ATCC 20868]EPE24505.1 hypothetical protein GLAREA_08357 [Glarea lozoyensis ATCC 20868]
MQYSVIAIIASAFTASVIAVPTGDTTPVSCPAAPVPTPTPTGGGPTPTGAPTYPADCAFTCTWPATIEILNCVNVITGTTVDIPINALNPPKTKRNTPDGTTKNYCCKPGGTVISAATCVDILTGDQISVPINLLNGTS